MNTPSTSRAYVGAQNDALYIVVGEPPASTNDYPRHDADRTAIAKVYDAETGRRLVACWNACLGIDTEQLEIITDADETFTTVRDRYVAQRDALLTVLQNFEITGPDNDGLVWLVMHGNGITGKGAVKLGDSRRIVGQVALLLEHDRRSAIAKATGSPT